jgi:hypothetical protein
VILGISVDAFQLLKVLCISIATQVTYLSTWGAENRGELDGPEQDLWLLHLLSFDKCLSDREGAFQMPYPAAYCGGRVEGGAVCKDSCELASCRHGVTVL